MVCSTLFFASQACTLTVPTPQIPFKCEQSDQCASGYSCDPATQTCVAGDVISGDVTPPTDDGSAGDVPLTDVTTDATPDMLPDLTQDVMLDVMTDQGGPDVPILPPDSTPDEGTPMACEGGTVTGAASLASFEGCHIITGFLEILGANDLSTLSSLTSITGHLSIEGTALPNLDGLSNLTSVGSHLAIVDNNSLINLDALSNLTTVGANVAIYGNSVLCQPLINAFVEALGSGVGGSATGTTLGNGTAAGCGCGTVKTMDASDVSEDNADGKQSSGHFEGGITEVPATVELWVKVMAAPPHNNFAFLQQQTFLNQGGLVFSAHETNGWNPWFHVENSASVLGFNAPLSSLLTGQWQHLAVVFNPEMALFYVDGLLRDSIPFTAPITPWSGGLQIGGAYCQDNTCNHLIYFDQIRFSDYPRYSMNFTPPAVFENDANTVALWHFDEGEGDTADDSSNEWHLQRKGGMSWSSDCYTPE